MVFRDITDRLNTEKQLTHALEELQDLKSRLEQQNEYLQEEILQEKACAYSMYLRFRRLKHEAAQQGNQRKRHATRTHLPITLWLPPAVIKAGLVMR